MQYRLLTLALFSCTSASLWGLPIGFRHNQGHLSYDEQHSEFFTVYHDKRTPNEARMVLEALERARPILQKWFAIRRKRQLPIITTAESANASFANFITDAIELQTLGQGDRTLFWHEYVHMIMFLHLRNFFGPPGVIIHIPWMPAWFLEGLAEALSVSVRSERQASLERFQALHDQWPSYDGLHSLYQDNFLRGYGTSGAFVAWLLRRGSEKHDDFLPKLMRLFFKYTLPHYYVLSMTPFTDFLPMDAALRELLDMDGKQLWEQYKKEAHALWSRDQNNRIFPLTKESPKRSLYNKFARATVHGGDPHISIIDKGTGKVSVKKLLFTDTGWHQGWSKPLLTAEGAANISLQSYFGDYVLAVENYQMHRSGINRERIVTMRSVGNTHYKSDRVIVSRDTKVMWLGESKSQLVWSEIATETTRICTQTKEQLGIDAATSCPIELVLPEKLAVIGADYKKEGAKSYVAKLWYRVERQFLTHSSYELWEWDLDSDTRRQLLESSGSRPYAAGATESGRYVLLAGHAHFYLQQLTESGNCTSEYKFDDFIVGAYYLGSNRYLFVLREGIKTSIRSLTLKGFKAKACSKRPEITNGSPIAAALANPQQEVSLLSALKSASPWLRDKGIATLSAKPLGTSMKKSASPVKAKWTPKPPPVMWFPWIGGNDARGNQLGLVSIPLMDQLQNETVLLTFLLGIPSGYPDTFLSLESKRYWPTLRLILARQQKWNGRFINERGNVSSAYVDQKSATFAASFPLFWGNRINLTITPAFTYADRRHYTGPRIPIEGQVAKPSLTTSLNFGYGRWMSQLTLGGAWAPEALNTEYDFNEFKANWRNSYNFWFLRSQGVISLEYARTRGVEQKTPLLRQVYFPLRSFVAGSGGSIYGTNFGLSGAGSLFDPRFGDTKARILASYSLPIVKDFDKLLWIMYLEEMRYTAYVNYGGAWRQKALPPRDALLLSHNHNLDFLFENKGVHFSLGGGLGQVRRQSVQPYLSVGFRAIF